MPPKAAKAKGSKQKAVKGSKQKAAKGSKQKANLTQRAVHVKPSALATAEPPHCEATATHDEDVSAGGKRRRCRRRDSDEVADRSVQGRLGHLPAGIWEGMRNAKGQSIRDVVKVEIGSKKQCKGRLSSKFWTGVFEDFGLSDSLAEQLAPPEGDESVDEDLVQALGVVHHENPASRRTSQLERFLDYCPELNRTSLFGLLRSVMESPTLTRTGAFRCQISVLKYMHRANAASKHKDYWQIMRPMFDAALQWCWEDLSQRGVSQAAFLAVHGKLLSMFVDEQDMVDIMECQGEFEKVALQVKRVVEASYTAKSVFKTALLSATRALFCQQIKERLRELEHLDFEDTEVVSFKKLMVDSSNGLQAVGHKIYKTSVSTLDFLGQAVPVPTEAANDEWEFRLSARAKTLALNAGTLEALPWEALLFAPGELHDTPQFAKVPEAMLSDAKAARSAASQFLREKGASTFHQMMTVINAKGDALRALDRSFELEIAYLNRALEPIVKERVRAQLLKCLPDETNRVTVQQAVQGMGQLKASPLVRAAHPELQGEVEGVLSLLNDLSMGISPREKTVQGFSDFFKIVLKRAENFFSLDPEAAPEDCATAGEGQLIALQGRDALRAQFRRLSENHKKGEQIGITDLQPLKTYAWCSATTRRPWCSSGSLMR